MESEYRSVRSIPNNRIFRANDQTRNIKMVNSRYVPSGIGSSYSTYDSRGYSPSNYGSSRTYTNVTKRVIPSTNFTKINRPYGVEKTIESKTYSFGPKEFKADLDSSLKREKARRIVQSKYINDQLNRPVERTLYEQRINPSYQTKTVSYGPPPDSSFRSSGLGSFGDSFKKNEYDTLGNIIQQHAKPSLTSRNSSQMGIVGKKITKKKKTEVKEKGKADPNTIEFSNKNGPETFTITHKTVTKKSKNQNKEKRKSNRKNPIYDKMIQENEEIKNMIRDFKNNGSNTTKLEEKINEKYKELEGLRTQNHNLNEKVWKVESDLNVKVIDLANKISENEKLNLTIDEMREDLMGARDDVENWKEKYQNEKQKNIFLEQQNKILEESNRKLESQLNEVQQRLMEADDKILQVSKENSGLATAKQMLEDKIRGMEKEIDRMNNMVSMTQSQMAPGGDNRSHFLGSEHNFGINTTFGKDPRKTEAKVIQGLNSQLAELRNEKEEIKGKLVKEKLQIKEQMTNLERLNLKMEKLKSENKMLKQENEILGKEKVNRHKISLDLEKQVLSGKSKLEGEEFKNQLQEEKIEKLKQQIVKIQKQKNLVEKEKEELEESWEDERENWNKERALKEGFIKEERRRRNVMESKMGNKDDFIEKLLDMLKIPLKGKESNHRMGDSLSSADYMEDEKRLYKRILEEIQMRNKQERIKGLFEMQRNMSPMGKDVNQFRGGSQGDIEIEQQIIQLKKTLENKEREMADMKRKTGLKETELQEEVKNLGKQVEEMKVERERALDKAKKFRTGLKEVEEKLEEEEDKYNKKVYELTKTMKEKEYNLKVIEHELGMKNTELDEKRQLAESNQELLRELKIDLKKKEQDLHEVMDDMKTKGRSN